MKKFVDYLGGYDHRIVEGFKAAPEEKIEELEELAGCPMPEDYRKFLRLCGDQNLPKFLLGRNWTDAGLAVARLQRTVDGTKGKFRDVYDLADEVESYFGKTYTDIDEIIVTFRDYVYDGFVSPDLREGRMTIAELWSYGDLLMDLKTQIIENSGAWNDYTYIKLADRLEYLLCSNTFNHFELKNREFKRYFETGKLATDPAKLMDDISVTAENLGLSKLWFSDSVRLHFAGPDRARLMAYYSNHEGLKIAIGADLEETYRQLEKNFVPRYQLNEFGERERWIIKLF